MKRHKEQLKKPFVQKQKTRALNILRKNMFPQKCFGVRKETQKQLQGDSSQALPAGFLGAPSAARAGLARAPSFTSPGSGGFRV